MRSVALAGLLGLLALARAQLPGDEHAICACTDCCHVGAVDLSYKNLLTVEYPAVSLSGNYTIVNDGGTHSINGTQYNGTPYQYVAKYENAPLDAFDVNLRIFTDEADVDIDCTQSFLYYGTEEDPAAYHKIPMLLNDETAMKYCYLDINEKLSRDELADDTNIYFAFNGLVDERATFRVMVDTANGIVPVDDILDYQYFLNETTLTADTADANYYINVDLLVSDINDMPVDGAGCMTLQEVMRRAHLNNDPDNCTLAYLDGFSEPADPADFASVLYRFKLDQADFERCATSVISDGETVVFKTTLSLDVRNDEATCFYFQPGFAEQEISVSMKAEINEGTSEQFAQFASELISVEAQRCTPIEDYVIPHAIVKFIVETTSANPDVRWNEASIPTLGADGLTLYGGHNPEIADPVPTYNCTTSGAVTTCHHYFHTRECSKVYTTQDDECAFERTDLNHIDNLVFQEYLDATFFLTHRTARIETNLEYTEFPADQCSAPDGRDLINVEDEYPSSLGVRNYFQDIQVDWSNETQIRFDDKVMVRMAVGEDAGAELQDLELFIKNVVVTLREPTGDQEILAQMSFNVAEKAYFMGVDWSLFYSDPVFCTYYSADDSSERCQTFFDPAQGRTNPLNAEGEALSAAKVAHMCHASGAMGAYADTRNVDYFVFDPKVWFADLYARAYLRVDIATTAVIHSCGPNSGGRRRLGEVKAKSTGSVRGAGPARRALADPEDDVMYVAKDISITIGTSVNETVTTTTVTVTQTVASLINEHRGAAVAIITTLALLSCGICIFVAARYRHYKLVSDDDAKVGDAEIIGSRSRRAVEDEETGRSSRRSSKHSKRRSGSSGRF